MDFERPPTASAMPSRLRADSGGALATVSAVTREAPLASLFVAFLLGVAVARRR
ncbi:hypothetical protein ABIA28_003707 [Bradyrhizobium elkanii]